MEILLLLMILRMVYKLTNQKEAQDNISCNHNKPAFKNQCSKELERQEREQYYQEYESKGRQKYYKIPCPWKNEE